MIRHILLPIDPDQDSSWIRALPEAVEEARRRGATLNIMTVVPDFGSSIVATFFPRDFERRSLAHAEQMLKTVIQGAMPSDIPHRLIVAHGRIYQEICRVAAEIPADLIIMASHKPNTTDAWLAPTARQVLNHSNASMFIIR